MKYVYPHSIDNGGGEMITFVNFIPGPDGGMLEIENRVQPGSGPPMHVHHLQDEALTVIEGKIGAQVLGQPATFHGPGETVTFKRGVPHRFWNAGDTVLVCHGYATPANNLEYFLTEIYKSTKANGGKRPSVFDGAYLQFRYKSEFDLVEVPGLVKAFIFPLILFFGTLRGKHKKFLDAPEPINHE